MFITHVRSWFCSFNLIITLVKNIYFCLLSWAEMLQLKQKKTSQGSSAGPKKAKKEQGAKQRAAPIPKKSTDFSSNWKLLAKGIVPENPIRPRRSKPKKMNNEVAETEKPKKGPSHIPKECLNKFGFIDYTHYGQLKNGTLDTIPEVFKQVTRCVAIDCEMVGVDLLKSDALARVSIVNEYGYCLFDTFVKPKLKVTDYRTAFSGVREEDLKTAPPLEEVMKRCCELLKGRILIGHALQHDLEVLYIQHPRFKVRDTSRYFRGHGGRTPSLKSLAEKYLKVEIQSGEHSSIQDAQAAMKLYVLHRKAWEQSLQERRRR